MKAEPPCLALLFAFLSLTIVCGCKKDQGPVSPTTPATTGPVSDAVAVLDSSICHLVSDTTKMNSGIYIFQYAGQKPDIRVNSIIIGSDSGGYLRKVTAVSFTSNTMTLTTDQATLEDVFVDGSFKYDADFSQPLLGKVEQNPKLKKADARLITKGLTDLGIQYNLSNATLWNIGSLKLTIPSGQVQFFPHLSFSLVRTDGTLQPQASFVNSELQATATVRAEFTKGINFSDEVTLATFKWHFVNLFLGIPIFAEIIVDLKASVEASASASIAYTFGTNFSDVISASVGGQGAYSFKDQPFLSFSNGSIEGGMVTSSLKLYLYPQVSLRLYKMVGPYLALKPYLQPILTVASPSLNWDAKLNAGEDNTIGIKAGIFSKKWFDFSKDIAGPQVTLWQEPKILQMVSGDNQMGKPGSPLLQPLTVKVLDSQNNPVIPPLVQVYYEVISGGGSVNPATTISDDQGLAQANWILGNSLGLQRTRVSVKDGSNNDISGSPNEFHANLLAKPTIALYPDTLRFTEDHRVLNPSSISLWLQNTGAVGSILNYTASANAAWLKISPSKGSVSSGSSSYLTVTVNDQGNYGGTQYATITIADTNATNSPQTAHVIWTISKPTIALSPDTFRFTEESGALNPPYIYLKLQNTGSVGSTLNYSASANATWLKILPPLEGQVISGGVTYLMVSVNDTGYYAGTYRATITIADTNATNSPQTAQVILTIPKPTITILSTQITLEETVYLRSSICRQVEATSYRELIGVYSGFADTSGTYCSGSGSASGNVLIAANTESIDISGEANASLQIEPAKNDELAFGDTFSRPWGTIAFHLNTRTPYLITGTVQGTAYWMDVIGSVELDYLSGGRIWINDFGDLYPPQLGYNSGYLSPGDYQIVAEAETNAVGPPNGPSPFSFNGHMTFKMKFSLTPPPNKQQPNDAR